MKDTNNLLSHNQWTAGEYENTIPIVLKYTLGVITNNYSSIGEQSLKLTKNASSGAYSRINYESIVNKTITASAHVRTNENSALLLLLEIDSNGNIAQNMNVTIPSNSHEKFSVSLVAGSNNSQIIIQFNNNGGVGSYIYVDDIILTAS